MANLSYSKPRQRDVLGMVFFFPLIKPSKTNDLTALVCRNQTSRAICIAAIEKERIELSFIFKTGQ